MDAQRMRPAAGLLNSTSPLGFRIGSHYVSSTKCEDTLDELLSSFGNKNKATRSIRQKCGSQISIAKELVTIVKEVDIEEPFVFKKTIKLLTFLTEPVELETSECSEQNNTCMGKMMDSRLLTPIIDACCSVQFLQTIKRKITILLEKAVGRCLSKCDCETINDCLLLLRNILQKSVDHPDQDTIVLKHVFESKLETILFALATHEQQDYWSAVTMQILWLMFKNHVDVLLKTSSKSYGLIGSFDTYGVMEMMEHEMLKKESTNNSSLHNDANDRGHTERDSGSVSSNEADIIVKCLLQFAMGFLRSAFSDLVGSLIRALRSSSEKHTDFYYLGWMISFFLKVAKKTAIVPVHMEGFMNKDVIGFLVNEAVQNSTRLTELKHQTTFCTLTHCRLDMAVSSLRQMFDMFLSLDDDDLNSNYLDEVARTLVRMNVLRYLFVLLLRNYDSETQSLSYLHEIIQTNHLFIQLLENWHAKGYLNEFDMLSHVKMFATYDIMYKYGSALETFEENDDALNKCILTIMYHVAGDCGKPGVLQQLPILKTFVNIWESNMHLADEFNDFMEYVMEEFLTCAEETPVQCALKLVEIDTALESFEFEKDGIVDESSMLDEENEDFEIWKAELKDQHSILDNMMQHFDDMCIENNPDLFNQSWLNIIVFANISSCTNAKNNQMNSELSMLNSAEVGNYLVYKVKEQGLGEHLKILQNTLLDVAFVKLGIEESLEVTHEPVAKFCTLLHKSVPITFQSEIHGQATDNLTFYALLHHLDLFRMTSVDAIFPVIKP